MFMGVAEMKVMGIDKLGRKLANEYGGCVIFLDELDAIASSRGGVEGDKNRPTQTGGIFGGGGVGVRSKLLSVMDGSKELHLRKQLVNFFFALFNYEPLTQGQVFWLGATNRLESIDPAFLRPGRMDITVQVDPPDKGSRRQIIQGYLNRITHDDTVDVERLTDDTQGFTPADVSAAVQRISARFTIARGADAVSMADIEAALTESVVGVANPIAEFDPGQREQVATHEAGHAVVSRLLLPEMRITSLSILRRGKGILGYMRDVSPDELYTFPFSRICARIQVAWAGDIACEILMGERWAGGSGDFSHVGTMMTVLAQHGVFADSLPLDPQNPFEEERINDSAIEYSTRVKAGTRTLIQDNIEVTRALRDGLLQHAELNSKQVYEIMEERGL
jgi:cell division protease FtsH